MVVFAGHGLGVEPGANIHRLVAGLEGGHVDQLAEIKCGRRAVEQPRPRRERAQPRLQCLDAFGIVGEIGLGQHDPVGHGHLPRGFDMGVEGPAAVHRVDHRDHARQREATREAGVGDQRLDGGRGVREARGLDDETREVADFPGHHPRVQAHQRLADVAPDGAA
jgi:hypothetical protein